MGRELAVQKIVTYWKLGLINLLRVAYYKLQIRLGIFRRKLPIGQPIDAPFFLKNGLLVDKTDIPVDASLLLQGQLRYFSYQLVSVSNPPNWFYHPEIEKEFPYENHWSSIGDFDSGDIKLIWEQSRFHWLVLAAQGYVATGDYSYVDLINRWLADWSVHNPVNQGANWKCGQESSIRLMNLLLAAFTLNAYKNPTPALVKTMIEHGQRIYPTLHYAVAQDNNHGTSEVVALFIVGAWLQMVGEESTESKKWLNRGRSGLEERVNHLIAEDGSFSQHSVNYHRLLLDTLSLAEFWRLETEQLKFSAKFYLQVNLAIEWLWQMTDSVTGDAPNLGANDGAQLFQLTGDGYRDFRPSIQLATALFLAGRAYGEKSDHILYWLKIDADKLFDMGQSKKSKIFKSGGYVSLVGESCEGLLRFPNFRFRPGHADLMHLEIMDHGKSVVCDGGSYSYNRGAKWLGYFSGVESHNTVQFDSSEPMPRLSRFLFAEWPETDDFFWDSSDSSANWSGGYTDYLGRKHHRTVELTGRNWRVVDKVSGFKERAILRWRLVSAEWTLTDYRLFSERAIITLETDGVVIDRMELVKGWASRYYNEKNEIPVLEVEVRENGVLTTTIELPKLR
jgi:hypothetical protein